MGTTTRDAVNRFLGEEAILRWATVVIFTRPEAKSSLLNEGTDVKEFAMQVNPMIRQTLNGY
jgi:hypothetical protein